jgi:predicted nucleotidyltransferase
VDDPHDRAYSREPQLDDLARVGRALNAHQVRYVLIGGFAVIAHGGARTTKDVDLLIDPSPENVAKIRDALQILEDNAVSEVADGDVARYSVVRIADEIVIDLMAAACGVDYAEASLDAVTMVFGGVEMPVASPRTLMRTKNTVRPSDAADRQFLRVLIDEASR